MTVYVDDAMIRARVGHGRVAVWSHMMADTVDELLEFATRLGLREEWLQDKRSGVHFDVTGTVRARALRAGAVEVEAGSGEWRRVVQAARKQHLERHAGCTLGCGQKGAR